MKFNRFFSVLALIVFSLIGLSSQGQTTYCDTVSNTIGLPDTVQLCQQNAVLLTANSGFASYQWSNGATAASTMAMHSGMYWLTVTDDSACVAIDSVVVSLINANLLQRDTFLCGANTYEIDIATYQSNVASASFNGSGAYGIFTDSILLAGNDARTVEFWMYNQGQTSEVGVFSYGDVASSAGFSISLDQNNLLKLKLNQNVYTAGSAISLNSWNHIVVSTTADLKYSFHVNGVSIGSGAITALYNTALAGNAYLGAVDASSLTTFNGLIDEFRIWEGNLSTSELIHYPTIHVNPLLDADLIFYLDFNELLVANYFDVSGAVLSAISVIESLNVPYANYLYLFDDVAGNISSYATTLIPEYDQMYTAIFYDGIGTCSDSVYVDLADVPNLPDTLIECGTDTILLSTTHVFDNYLWSTGAAIPNLPVTSSGIYTLTVSDSTCVMFDTALVSLINVEILEPDSIICFGDTITLNATSSINDFYWSTDEYTSSISIVPEASGQITVTSTNAYQSCSDYFWVTVKPLPEITLPVQANYCNVESALLTETFSANNSYWWNTGDTSNFLLVNTSGIYDLTITSNFGCVAEGSTNVNLYQLNILQSDTVLCTDEQLQLSLESNVLGYEWSTGEGTPQILIDPALGTEYYAFYTQAGFVCADTVHIQLAAPIVSNLADSILSCDAFQLSLTASSGYASYQWSTGSTSNSTGALSSGIYYLTITDSLACSLVDTIFISLINAEISEIDSVLCAGETIMLNSNSVGYDYLWNTGDTTALFFDTPMESTYYEVTVSNGFSSCIYHTIAEVNEVETGLIYGETFFIESDTARLYYIFENVGSTYEWFVSGGLYDPSQVTNDSIFITWDHAGTGYVSVTETNAMGCVGEPVVLNVSILDVVNLGKNNQIKLFPNPAESLLNVVIDEPVSFNVLTIIDMLGQEVMRLDVDGQQLHRLNISELPNGIYQLKIEGVSLLSTLFIVAH